MSFAPLMRVISAVAILLVMAGFVSTVRADQKAVADARKSATDADVAAKKAQAAYDKTKEAVKAELAKTPEYSESAKALSKAKADLDAATKPTLDKVHSSGEYIAAKKSFDASDAQAKAIQLEIRNGGAASLSQQLVAATTARAAAKTKMEALENDALASNPEIQSARTAVTGEQKKLDELNGAKLQSMVDENKECQDAKKALDEAQAKLVEAKTNLDNAIKQNREESKNKKGSGGGKGGSAGGHGH